VQKDSRLAHGHPPAAQGQCAACHEPHQSEKPGLLKDKTVTLCGNCHTALAKRIAAGSPHPPVAMGMCLTCHAPHGSASEGMLKREGAAMCATCHSLKKPELVAKHTGIDLPNVSCVSCHDPHVQAKGRKGLMLPFPHLPFVQGQCQSCHTSRGAKTTVARGAELCFKCHQPLKDELEQRKFVHAPVRGTTECLACHGEHGGQAQPVLRRTTEALCFGCHDRKIMGGSIRHAALDQGCLVCHDPHASEDSKMLKKPQPELCQTCHRDLSKHYHPAFGKTDPRTGGPLVCSACHDPHTASIEGMLRYDPKRDLCIQCHDPNMAPAPKPRR
jgi:predicted CXXCH cytochrome family protein